MKDEEFFTSLGEAAKYARTCRQAIFLAIQKKRLKATKKMIGKTSRWLILKKDLDEYRLQKYNCDNRKVDGEAIIDMEKGKWSVAKASKVLSMMTGRPYPEAHIYYLLRTGQLRGNKRGGMWVIQQEDLNALYEKEWKHSPMAKSSN